jgi:predicted SprT family Zn-dependent metalloprotease
MDLNDAAAMGRRLLDEHGLQDWRLAFDRAKRRAGVCRWARKEIGLSAPLTSVHPEAEVRDTVLHEIAHALVGPQHGHDAVWRATAQRIGCTGLRCSSEDAPSIDGEWVGLCDAGHRTTRHRRPERPMACRRCAPRFHPDHLFTWTFRGRSAPMTPGYVAELDRLQAPAAGAPPTRVLRAGDRLRIVAEGQYRGVVGTLVKRGRTRYHLEVDGRVVTVPFPLAEPL